MFTALLVTPTLVLLEKHSPASFRTYMTPVKDTSYLLATFITALLLLVLQVLVILAIASIFFSEQVLANAPAALILLLIINSFFILVGMIIGYAFNSEESATLTSVSVGAIFLFLSDVIIPIESMPTVIAFFAKLNPYVLGTSLLRRTFIFDVSVFSLLGDTTIFLFYLILAAAAAMLAFLLTRKYTMQQLIKKYAPAVKEAIRRKGR